MENFPFYVTMTDTFMSGWGKAKGKLNKLVIGCDSYKEASIVATNAKLRGDQKHINIRTTKPYYKNHLVSFHTKEDYGNWFINEYFKD